MISVFDVETSFQITEEGKRDPSAKNPKNFLVSLGINDEYFFFNHSELPEEQAKGKIAIENKKKIQSILDETTLLIGHNIKFDLLWLWESGFKYDGKVCDTMLIEYVFNRGIKRSISLKECCAFRGVIQKSDLTEGYIKNNISFEHIPIGIVEEYGRIDVKATRSLYDSQMLQLRKPQNRHLIRTIQNMCQFVVVLTKMEDNGIYIDREALDVVEKNFKVEYDELRVKIEEETHYRMGDTKINPASPEQLSWVIYGVKVKDKKTWSKTFNLGIDKFTKKQKRRPRLGIKQLKQIFSNQLEPIFKTKAEQCPVCRGKGTVQKIKVDGSPYKNLSSCQECKGEGFVYIKLNDRAGFSGKVTSVNEISEGGFKSDRKTLAKISATSDDCLKEFTKKIIRHNALETYLNTFVEGIKKFTTEKGFLYPSFRQTGTRTGRLASRNPNFQNQPRGNTFPIRKVISSRFDGGKIMEIDFAQLEFRTAVFLAQDKQGMEDIKNGVDVHQYTADIIGCSRQDAKAHTFKPLYGGMSGSENEKKYYSAFLKKYPDIKVWHDKLQTEALRTKVITLPTGRQYAFPKVERMSYGGSSFSTQIKNYPVQGFATADIVPLACIGIQELLEEHKTKSLLINTVHDSIVADVFPGEEKEVAFCLNSGCLGVIQRMKDMYGIDFNVPLDVELKVGSNWLETKVYT